MNTQKAQRLKVLVIDDTPVNLLVAQRLLESEGYDVFVARTIWEAMTLLGREQVDVVVTDVELGRGSFHELHRTMTMDGRESAPYKRVIVMSGTMTYATQQAFWRYGELVHEFVQKGERMTPQGEGTVPEWALVAAVRSAVLSVNSDVAYA